MCSGSKIFLNAISRIFMPHGEPPRCVDGRQFFKFRICLESVRDCVYCARKTCGKISARGFGSSFGRLCEAENQGWDIVGSCAERGSADWPTETRREIRVFWPHGMVAGPHEEKRADQ